VALPRRAHARLLVPREILRAAQRLQRLEISSPRSGSAQDTLVRQSTSSAQTLERAQVSACDGIVFLELLHLPSGRVHRVARAFAHRAKHRDVGGVGQVFFHDRGDDIEGKAREPESRRFNLLLQRAPHLLQLGTHRVALRLDNFDACFRLADARLEPADALVERFELRSKRVVRLLAFALALPQPGGIPRG
jgi:hypothetical protein